MRYPQAAFVPGEVCVRVPDSCLLQGAGWPVWAALVPGEEAEGSRPAGAEGLPRAPAPLDCLTPGTFYARERVAALYGFVREALQNDWLPFELLASGGQKLSEDENLAFNECGLVSDGSPHLNPTLWALVKSSQAPKRGWDGTGEVSLGVRPTFPLVVWP